MFQCTAITHQTSTLKPFGEPSDLGLGRSAGAFQPLPGLDIEGLLQGAPGDATGMADKTAVIVHEGSQHDVELPELRALSAERGQFRVVESDGHRRSAAAQLAGVDPVHQAGSGRVGGGPKRSGRN